jgi:hypothetical protein
MKRFIGFGLVMGFLLGAFFVQAQQECSDNLTRRECDVYESAVDNLHGSGDLYFNYAFNMRLVVGTNEERWINMSGNGILERNPNGEVDWLGLDGFMAASSFDYFNLVNRYSYLSPIYLILEENELAVSLDDRPGTRYETNLETLELERFFPSLDLEISDVFTEEFDNNFLLYQFSFSSEHLDSPFLPVNNIIMGESEEERIESAFYEGSILIDRNDEEILGTVFNATEFLDGEAYGQPFPLRRTTQFSLQFRSDAPEQSLDFRIANEAEDTDNIFEEAADYGLVGILLATVYEPLSDIFPSIPQNANLRGGLNIGGMGNNIPTATATATPPRPTGTPYPTFTPIPLTPNADGYPCNASIIEGDETFFDVVYNQPDTSNPPVRALRPSQEITLEEAVDTEDGRWYRLSLNGAPFGYIQEEYIVLGEACPR